MYTDKCIYTLLTTELTAAIAKKIPVYLHFTFLSFKFYYRKVEYEQKLVK